MASARAVRSPRAQRDLFSIWHYIAHENAPSIADAFLARLTDAMSFIASAPHIGRERPDLPGNLRSFSVRPYAIFYQIIPEGDGIVVVRVIHSARDLPRRLG